ncbi:carboxypeptidase-like regulatory domain-containing protein [Sphingobacterium paludis]|uniref:Uncharacterized protein n=1 Tax=Sphingobacterium paludis TaxID=1476465 RepID=A0A4R7CXC7_9SPHI|nr:carboxypeptidase-like regulatory domain-containing protein [Sphingobacterium paludis]TDS11754.1 hypothetical protein B0I21_10797 [Sphingobacterium paludis]
MKIQTQLTSDYIVKNWSAKIIILAFALVSCRSNKYSNDLPSIDQYNGSSYTQKGFDHAETGDSAIVSGRIRYFGSEKPISEARIVFINIRKDTVISVKTDKNGKFKGGLSFLGFSGKAVVARRDIFFEIPNITIYPIYKNYSIDIKIPRPLEIISPDKYSKKDMKELSKYFKEQKKAK